MNDLIKLLESETSSVLVKIINAGTEFAFVLMVNGCNYEVETDSIHPLICYLNGRGDWSLASSKSRELVASSLASFVGGMVASAWHLLPS